MGSLPVGQVFDRALWSVELCSFADIRVGVVVNAELTAAAFVVDNKFVVASNECDDCVVRAVAAAVVVDYGAGIVGTVGNYD